MNRLSILIALLLGMSVNASAQISPGAARDSAELFGEGNISDGDFELSPAFTPDGRTVFFNKSTINFGYMAIFSSKRTAAGWSKPKAVSFTGHYHDTDPFVTYDGKRLYFNSDRPLPGKNYIENDTHLFYVKLDDDKIISQPALVDLPFKPLYPTFAENGNLYFFSVENGDPDIFCSKFVNGNYSVPVRLSFNDKKLVDFDPLISKNETFLIFASYNRKGFGDNDLWITYRNGDTWSEPINLGDKINTSGKDGTPRLSSDNETFYFTSMREKIDFSGSNSKMTTQKILDILHSSKNGLRKIYQISVSALPKR